MFSSFFKKIDEVLNSIPYKIRKIIIFFSFGVWIFLAIMVAFFSFRKGKESAPIIGEDLYLSEFKEKLQQNKNLKKSTNSLILPDINELVKEEAPLKIESLDMQTEKKDPFIKKQEFSKRVVIEPVEDKTLFPEKKDNSYNETYAKEKKIKLPAKNRWNLLPVEN